MPVGNDDLVTEFPRHSVTASLEYTVHDHRATDSGTESDEHEPRFAPARAETPFGPRCRVRVIEHRNAPSQGLFEIRSQRFVAPRQVRAEQHGSVVQIHPPGRSDTHRADAPTSSELAHQVHDHRFDRPRILPGGFPAGGGDDCTGGVDDAGSHLGAADIDAYGEPTRAQRAGSVT